MEIIPTNLQSIIFPSVSKDITKGNSICLCPFDKVLRKITMFNSVFMGIAQSRIVLYTYTVYFYSSDIPMWEKPWIYMLSASAYFVSFNV
jgi:hypothetical protein